MAMVTAGQAEAFRNHFNYRGKKLEPVTKLAAERSTKNSRHLLRVPLAQLLPSSIDENCLIERFQAHRRTIADNLPTDVAAEEVKYWTSYIKEHKLAAICYAKATYVKKSDDLWEPISQYTAAQNLGIQSNMLKSWQQNEDKIWDLKRGVRKNHTPGVKESELEQRLIVEFEMARAIEWSINGRWFKQKVLSLYKEMYSH